MGYMSALGMAEMCNDLDTLLRWHLQHNHFPPVPVEMVPYCKRAINYAKKGRWDTKINIQGKKVKVWILVEQLHLDAFLPEQGGEY